MRIAELRREAPNNAGVHFISAVLYRYDGEYDKALHSLDRMLRLNPLEGVVVSYNRARIFIYRGPYDDALLELDRAIELDHPLVRAFRAQVLFLRGDSEAAADLLQEVLLNNPELDAIRPM